MREIRLDVSIAPETVAPVIEVLQNAVEDDEVLLYMRHNGGGDVNQLFMLIGAISQTKAKVTISFGRYVMSAAATLWLWFLLWPAPNVTAAFPRKPAVLMYHRPRWMAGTGEHYCFAEDFPEEDPRRAPLEWKVDIFDQLFEQLLQALGWNEQSGIAQSHGGASCKHWLYHLREAYYGNKDCLIPVQLEEA